MCDIYFNALILMVLPKTLFFFFYSNLPILYIWSTYISTFKYLLKYDMVQYDILEAGEIFQYHHGEYQKRKWKVEKTAGRKLNGFELWVFWVVYLKQHTYKCQKGIHSFHKYFLSVYLVPGTILKTWLIIK